MSSKEIYLEIDDYLDLYLLAGNLGDTKWQEDMIEQLQNYQTENRPLAPEKLLEEYKRIKLDIFNLYSFNKKQPNHKLVEQIKDLKQKSKELSRKIGIEE